MYLFCLTENRAKKKKKNIAGKVSRYIDASMNRATPIMLAGCHGVTESATLSSNASSASTEPWFCDACKAGVTPVSGTADAEGGSNIGHNKQPIDGGAYILRMDSYGI